MRPFSSTPENIFLKSVVLQETSEDSAAFYIPWKTKYSAVITIHYGPQNPLPRHMFWVMLVCQCRPTCACMNVCYYIVHTAAVALTIAFH